MVQTQTNKQTKIKQNITKTPEKKSEKKKEKEMYTQMESQKTAGIPCNWEALVFTPRDHHLSSDKAEHTFHHTSIHKNSHRAKKIFKQKRYTLGLLIFSNTCHDFDMIPNYLLISNMPGEKCP